MRAGRLVDRKFKRYEERYEEERGLIEEHLGRPHMYLRVEMPEGCEGMEEEFANLREDKQFVDDLKDLVKRHLERKRRERRGVGA